MKTTFYRCNVCGNIIVKVADSGIPVECCGDYMEEITPKVEDLGLEKHLPKVTRLDKETIQVEVGGTPHPMTPDHYIHFIFVEHAKGGLLVYLQPEDKPMAQFKCTEKIQAVYEYCNIHGLWKTEIQE